MFDALWKALEGRDQRADRLRQRLERATPTRRIHAGRAQLATLAARLKELERDRLGRERHRLGAAAATLEALSPLKVLGRGYSVVFRAEDGRLVRRAEDVQAGELLRIRLAGSTPGSLAGCDEIDARVEAAQPAPPARKR
jgi:exodeoxyribonuclease VII large subunit